MKAIKCPNCGSEQVKELTEEKYACMACDNVFLIHNHSKEFRKTDEHISSMHQDLKDDISKLMNSNNIDPDAIIEKAEQHLKKKDWDIASDLYDKATQENPDKSKAWYGLYRALTGDFEAVDRYALFVCDGNYFDDDDKLYKIEVSIVESDAGDNIYYFTKHFNDIYKTDYEAEYDKEYHWYGDKTKVTMTTGDVLVKILYEEYN